MFWAPSTTRELGSRRHGRRGITDGGHTAHSVPPRVATGEPPGAAGRLPCQASQHHAYVSRLVVAHQPGYCPPQEPCRTDRCLSKAKGQGGSNKIEGTRIPEPISGVPGAQNAQGGGPDCCLLRLRGPRRGAACPRGTCDTPARMPCCSYPHGMLCRSYHASDCITVVPHLRVLL